MIKVLIADDHPVVRKGLREIVKEAFHVAIADEVSNGQEVLERVAKNDYDVVLLDISMPGRNGLDVLKELKGQKPKLSVLVLSIYPEEQYAVRVLKAGASGYLTKESAQDELISAIQKVSTGRKYISPSLAERLALDLEMGAEKPPHESLSDREYQVMCMIASGKTVKEIAEELFLSVKTVSTYRARLLDKMRMKSNAELTYYAIKHRLID
jgi:two-component system invasion response regulator UvrY